MRINIFLSLNNKRNGQYPNGQKFKEKDYIETQQHIDNCTEILNHYGCELPTVEPKQEPQLTLF